MKLRVLYTLAQRPSIHPSQLRSRVHALSVPGAEQWSSTLVVAMASSDSRVEEYVRILQDVDDHVAQRQLDALRAASTWLKDVAFGPGSSVGPEGMTSPWYTSDLCDCKADDMKRRGISSLEALESILESINPRIQLKRWRMNHVPVFRVCLPPSHK